MRSRLTTSVTMFAILASAPAPIPLAMARSVPAPDQGFCRNAGALPQLDPEAQPQRQQTNGSIKTKGGSKRDRDGVMAVEAAPPPPSLPPPPPAMAPPPPSYADGDGASEVVVTGSRISSSAADAPAPVATSEGYAAERSAAPPVPGSSADSRMPPRPYPRPQPQPQSGILTAGEHDDLLNPELYASYVHRSGDLGQEVRSLPRVDTTRVVTVKVGDRSGQPIPFADVIVTCSDGNSITMATQADGSAVFFPDSTA
ncbi:hypothetical protein [Sphingopyxis fribergensis]